LGAPPGAVLGERPTQPYSSPWFGRPVCASRPSNEKWGEGGIVVAAAVDDGEAAFFVKGSKPAIPGLKPVEVVDLP